MVMTEAVGPAADVHTQMPVLLAEDDWTVWTDGSPRVAKKFCVGWSGEFTIDRPLNITNWFDCIHFIRVCQKRSDNERLFPNIVGSQPSCSATQPLQQALFSICQWHGMFHKVIFSDARSEVDGGQLIAQREEMRISKISSAPG